MKKIIAIALSILMIGAMAYNPVFAADTTYNVHLKATKCYDYVQQIYQQLIKYRTNDSDPYNDQLNLSPTVTELAMTRAVEMSIAYNSDHSRPDNTKGNNIGGYTFVEVAAADGLDAVAGWYNEVDEGHREAILSDNVTVGIGYVETTDGHEFVVAEFSNNTEANLTKSDRETAEYNIASTNDNTIITLKTDSAYNTADSYAMKKGDTKEIPLYEANSSMVDCYTKLENDTCTWTTSNSSVATVDSDGVITAVNNGTATITGTWGQQSVTANVRVGTDISGATVSGLSTKTYTGSAITQTPTITLNGNTLTQGTDYTVAYKNNVNAGTATATITGAGDYVGTKESDFTISPMNVKNLTPQYKSGEETMKLVNAINGDVIKGTTDATYHYYEDQYCLLYTYTGIGNYTGTVDYMVNSDDASIFFKYTPELSSVTFSDSATYDGSEHKLDPVVKDTAGNLLVEGTDYTVAYTTTDFINAGTVKGTVTGINNYDGKTLDFSYSIDKKDASGAELSDIPDQTYTGSKIVPSVTVTLDGKALTEDTDYTVDASSDNSSTTQILTVTFIGNYSGTTSEEFYVKKNTLSDDQFSLNWTSTTYDGGTKSVVVNSSLQLNTDYEYYGNSAVNAGTYTVAIKGINAYTGYIYKTYTINPCDINNLRGSFSVDNASYTGGAVYPTVHGAGSYSTYYYNNVNVGTGYVRVTGNGNYNGSFDMGYSIYAPAVVVKAPGKVTIKSVSAGKKKLTVKYKSISGCRYQVAVKKSGSGWKYYSVSGTSKTVTKLSSKKKYSVKVRALRSGKYGSWSKTKTVKVK